MINLNLSIIRATKYRKGFNTIASNSFSHSSKSMINKLYCLVYDWVGSDTGRVILLSNP